MGKQNGKITANSRLNQKTNRTSKLDEHEFAEELSDGGERDQIIEKQAQKKLKS